MKSLDLRGLDCPEPAIYFYREFGKLDVGETLEALMDSEACAYTAAELVNRSGLGAASVLELKKGLYRVSAVRLSGPRAFRRPL